MPTPAPPATLPRTGTPTARMDAVGGGAPGGLLIFSVSPGALNCAKYNETSSLVTFECHGVLDEDHHGCRSPDARESARQLSGVLQLAEPVQRSDQDSW